MITADCHVHTQFSGDSSVDMESVVVKAMELGLTKICFTDHMDYDYPIQYDLNFTFSVEEYLKEIDKLSIKYQNRIEIYKGIELGLVPNLASKYRDLVRKYPFDFVIGSSHLVENLDPYYKEFWENKVEETGYLSYFQTIIDNMKAFDDFDSYGHMDYIVRYGPNKNQYYTYERYADIIDEILRILIANGKALEINSAGYKYGLGHMHPQEDVLKRYKELGGELITIGSDAHKLEHLAYDFHKVREVLLTLGFEHYAVYEKRKPKLLKL